MLQVLRAQIPAHLNGDINSLHKQIIDTASLRLRPVLMTAAAMIAGLMPVMFGSEPGSEVMERIAAPVIGGLLSSVVVTLLVLPVVYFRLLLKKAN
jgi:Cu(I)/Ag(I) efflux system membrane protein CusA/SilA